MGRYFGTDGIRGEANKSITSSLALKVGKALKSIQSEKVIIAYDTRISNHMLANALAAGALSVNKNVVDAGVMSSPALSFACAKHHCLGVMITASHNPYTDNGIKIFFDGIKLSEDKENTIEELIDNSIEDGLDFSAQHLISEEPLNEYIEYANHVAQKSTLKIGIDCANGATYHIGPKVFNKISANVVVSANNPDGFNINRGVGSTHIENIAKLVVDNKLDIGFAFDGDADRLLVVDDKGKLYSGDEIIYIVACYLKSRNKLTNNTVVLTVMSNLGIIKALKNQNINVVTTPVGDHNVLASMLQKNYVIGGENSGHIINMYYLNTGDGVLAAIALLNILTETKKTLKELTSGLIIYPDKIVNIKVRDKSVAKDIRIQSRISDISKNLGEDVKIIVRASGTENLIRVSCCAPNQDDVDKYINEFVTLVNQLDKGE